MSDSRGKPPGRRIPPAVDLHVHTRLSDGTETPFELLSKTDGQLSLIAICDHDTLAAYGRFPASRRVDQQSRDAIMDPAETSVLQGIELSAVLPDGSGIHVLGYFPNGVTADFESFVSDVAIDRTRRVRAGVVALRKRGLGIRFESIEKQMEADGVWCRSHVSRALMEMGVARNQGTIFKRFLRSEAFQGPDLLANDAIRRIRDSNGVAVWAHPWMESVGVHLDGLVEAGLDGLEVRTPHRRPSHAHTLRQLCKKHGLIETGGSDHHGTSARSPIGTFRIPWDSMPDRLLSTHQ